MARGAARLKMGHYLSPEAEREGFDGSSATQIRRP
jgi:hypothetical protein